MDGSSDFAKVMELFDEWLEAHDLKSKFRFAVATDWYVHSTIH